VVTGTLLEVTDEEDQLDANQPEDEDMHFTIL
jgi:hypothetical protein